MNILIPYLHYISIMVLMGSLITEHVVLKPGISAKQIKSLGTIDTIYGISAIVVLATGLLRWFVYGKGSAYYLSNPIFHTKLTLFVIMGVLSILPTVRFIKWNKRLKAGESIEVDDRSARKMLMFIRIQLLLIAVIPLLAVMMARGMGQG
jgi:putative membrane protein